MPSKLNKSENKQNQSTFSSYKHGIDEKRCLYQLSIENMILELKITFYAGISLITVVQKESIRITSSRLTWVVSKNHYKETGMKFTENFEPVRTSHSWSFQTNVKNPSQHSS